LGAVEVWEFLILNFIYSLKKQSAVSFEIDGGAKRFFGVA